MTNTTTSNIFAADTKNIVLCQGESNGCDDSDGFITYFNTESGKVETDHWTTRFYCQSKRREGVKEFRDLSEEQQQVVCQAAAEKALEILQAQAKNDWQLIVEGNGSFKNLPVIVEKGRLFKGKGLLFSIEEKTYSYYGYGYRRNVSTSRRAWITTENGDRAYANADNVRINLDAIDLHKVADKYAFDILREDGYNGNIVRYSSALRLSHFVVKTYQA